MQEITPGVHIIEGLRICNVFVLVSDGELALIDTGLAGDVSQIVAQIEQEGHTLSALRYILITHAHADHVGGLAELARRSSAQILAHREEVPYVEGTENMPAGTRFQRMMKWLADRAPHTDKRCSVGKALEDGETVAILGGLKVIHTPGHTPGSICLLLEERKVLFCGDLLLNGNPITRRGGLEYAPRLFSLNHRQAVSSVQRLAELKFETLCFAHGEPYLTGARERIEPVLRQGARA